MIREHLKGYGHEVWTELGDCPHNRQALQFGGWVRLFSLVQSPRSAADDALLAIPDLSQDSTEASCGGVGVQPECLAEIRESSDYYYYYYYYIPDCKPQLGELDAKNPKAPAGKTAQ